MTPPAESESCIGFSCSRRCSEPLKSVREVRQIDFGGLNNFLSFGCARDYPATYSLARFGAKAVQAAKIDLLDLSD